jgi:hypothetical protein
MPFPRALPAAVAGVLAALAAPASAQTFPAAECGDRLVSPTPKVIAQGLAVFDAPADVDGDGTIDEVMGDDAGVHVTYRGANAKPPRVVNDSARPATVLAIHDLDGVKGAELVVQRSTGIEVLGADASGSLVTLATLKKGQPVIGTNVVLPGYFRDAKQPELLIGDGFSQSFALYALSGGELTQVSGIEPLTTPAVTDLTLSMLVADMDGDGLDDIVLGMPKGANFARLGNRTSWDFFQMLATTDDSSDNLAVAVGDFDGDGRRDILSELVPSGGMGVLATWLQKTPGQFMLLPELSRYDGWSDKSPILTGDLDGDGKDDFVAGRATGRLVDDTWHYSAASTGAKRLGLFDWDGDGILEYTSTDDQSRLTRERAALSDLELTLDGSQSQLDVSGALSAQLVVTNHGPTATEGFAFTTTLPGASIDGCADNMGSMSAAVLEPGASCIVHVSQSDTTLAMPGAFDMTVCGGAPEVDASNNRVELPVTKTDLADAIVGMSSAFETTGAFSATAYVVNNGRAEAHNLSLRMTVAPPPATTPTVATSETSATCTTDGRGATCTLDSLKFGGNWAVTLSGLRYTGSEITITSTVTTGSPDPDSSNNQYVLDIPAGLKPPGGGSFPDTPGSTPGSRATPGTKTDSGCACSLRRQPSTGATPWLLVALFATWRSRGRRQRRRART